MKKGLTDPPLLWRLISFGLLFLLLSGILGPRIINHSLVGQFGFEVYGGAGKALVFGLIAFGILTFRKLRNFEAVSWSSRNLFWLAGSAAGFVIAWIAITHLQTGSAGFVWPALAHFGIVTSVFCAFFACLGLATVQKLWQHFRREILLSLALGIGFYIFLEIVYSMWSLLSTTATQAVYWLLQRTGLPTALSPPYVLILGSFAVEISKYCSGIESIALFTGFYVVIGLLDHSRFNMKKYYLAFLPGLFLVFLFNIIRIYALMLVGYYVNPDMALRLFHTYAGMVIFIIVTGLFWLVAYKWMLKTNKTSAQ